MSKGPGSRLPTRPLGTTGLNVSVLGLGGFHQVEAEQATIDQVVSRYLEAGGNYIETAKGYGGGASETKLGRALLGRRDGVILASKTGARDAEGAWRDINESLERLQTDRIDVHFFHGIGTSADLGSTRAPGGAAEAFQKAREQGLVRYIGVSSHWPMTYVEAVRHLPIDVALIWGNYLDFCGFPEIPGRVLPVLRSAGCGVLFMKPVADGFLYRSPRPALRYALAQDADCLVAGFNSLTMLETDLAVCCDPAPVAPEEVTAILRDAPELGDYVCRQCEACTVGGDEELLKQVFELEGKVDRQMDDRRPVDAAQYALRERLKGWFGTAGRARAAYAELGEPAADLAKRELLPCRYGIDIPRKLRIAHAKLGSGGGLNLL